MALLAWTSLRTLRETPTREVGLDLADIGWVTLTLKTDPFPPVPSGTVILSVSSANNRGISVDLGPSLPFTFGDQDSPTPLGRGTADQTPDNGYQAGVQFPTPGNYWLAFDLGGGQQAKFSIYVEPAQ